MAFYIEMKVLLETIVEAHNTLDTASVGNVQFTSLEQFVNIDFDVLPAEIDISSESRIIAIGDIHGDFLALLVALRSSGVIDADGFWIGGSAIVVICGDVLDKEGRGISTTAYEREELDIIQYLYFQNKLLKGNGGVRLIAGNHEYMNFQPGTTAFEHKTHIKGWGGSINKRKVFTPGALLSNYFHNQVPVILRINHFLFVHGGLDISHVEDLCTKCNIICKLNHEWKQYTRHNHHPGRILLDILNTRRFSQGSGAPCKDTNSIAPCRYTNEQCVHLMSRLFERMNLDLALGGMVVGHTVQTNGIQSYCNGHVWRVDVGLSSAFGHQKTGSILIITVNNSNHNKQSTVDVVTYQTKKSSTFWVKVLSYLKDKRIGMYTYKSQWSTRDTGTHKYNIPSPLHIKNQSHNSTTLDNEEKLITLPDGSTQLRVTSKHGNHVIRKQVFTQSNVSTG